MKMCWKPPTPDGLMDDDDLGVSIRGHLALFDLAETTAGRSCNRLALAGSRLCTFAA